LEQRAAASSLLPSLAEEHRANRAYKFKQVWKDAETAKSRIEFARVLYLARRISFQEYIFVVSQAVEGVHDGRMGDKAYPELEKISAAMERVEKKHGLSQGEFWPVKDAPSEYRRLNQKWSAAADVRFVATLTELEGHEAASLYQANRAQFERLRERGRRSVFHKDDLIPALADTVKRYEIEAKAAARASAFTAAVTLLGAAMEGLLLLRCLRSPKKANETAVRLPPKQRPKDPSAPARWTFDNLIQVCLHAGWLPRINTQTMSVMPDGLAHVLRDMRNQIHPGRVCTDRPWVELEQRDFDDAELIYTTLFVTVFRGAMLHRFTEPNHDGNAV
jgi:hypothetical protein